MLLFYGTWLFVIANNKEVNCDANMLIFFWLRESSSGLFFYLRVVCSARKVICHAQTKTFFLSPVQKQTSATHLQQQHATKMNKIRDCWAFLPEKLQRTGQSGLCVTYDKFFSQRWKLQHSCRGVWELAGGEVASLGWVWVRFFYTRIGHLISKNIFLWHKTTYSCWTNSAQMMQPYLP